MARKISGRDLFSLPRYQKGFQYLDNEQRLINNPGLFSSAVLSITMPSSGFCTAVQSLEEGPYPFIIGQLYRPASNLSARLVFLAPGEFITHPGYGRVINFLTAQAGERGAVQVLAEVPLNSPEEETLFQTGFRGYAEQQIWKLPQRLMSNTGRKTWIPVSIRDQEQVISLYQRVVPAVVQRVEAPPSRPEIAGMICRQDERAVGFAETRFGPKGILIDLILEPELTEVDELLGALFYYLPYRNTRNVYFRVRSYQERIASALERTQAEPSAEQKTMVKRLAVYYNAKQTFRVQGFEKQPDITTPISNTKIKN